tara:strand:+ start:170 stop:442 length:273 start_codon:yes stop_codon:yes gene_type:complete
VKQGDKVKLMGKTKHGKNRVNEQGAFWTVVEVKEIEHSSGFAPRGTEVALLSANKDPMNLWRWVEIRNDKNFFVTVMSNDIQDLEEPKKK